MVEYHRNYETDEDIVIKKYSQKNINIVNRKLKINHDGFDRDGPDSCSSYDYYIYYRIGYNYYFDVWHKADSRDDDPYYLRIYKMKQIYRDDNELREYLRINHVY
tara:strand:- start:492 stop:806 length:315 start_codon:yes stop_codon:yes gene_type:complete